MQFYVLTYELINNNKENDNKKDLDNNENDNKELINNEGNDKEEIEKNNIENIKENNNINTEDKKWYLTKINNNIIKYLNKKYK